MAAALRSFIPVAESSHFPIQNLPFGVFRPSPAEPARVGIAIGDFVLDLSVLESEGIFDGPHLRAKKCFTEPCLNSFMAFGKGAWKEARATLTSILSENGSGTLRDNEDLRARALIPRDRVTMELPVEIGDYTDFYSSREHATNCTSIFRGSSTALPENWIHIPVAYHGRASSVVVSGTPVQRPKGQKAPAPGATMPGFGACDLLDFELEMGALVGCGNALGSSVSVDSAWDHVFGLVLLNDWSARDIQKWEYIPLGPFLGKSFATTISPWVVSMEALEPFMCEAPAQDPPPLEYLKETRRETFDITLKAFIQTKAAPEPSLVCTSNFRHLYWTIPQQVAHHTINGCNLRTGDLLGSGTISGQDDNSWGSLLELSWGGTRHVSLGATAGEKRKFLEDGDTVVFTGVCGTNESHGFSIGFGECAGRIMPA